MVFWIIILFGLVGSFNWKMEAVYSFETSVNNLIPESGLQCRVVRRKPDVSEVFDV
jgi:hypothetical protein